MKCPHDGADTRVLYTRGDRRRRECEHCGHRFTTLEVTASRRDMATARRLGNARRILEERGILLPAET